LDLTFNNQKVILTGATGFLGSHILEKLLEFGCDVAIIKRSYSDTWRINSSLDKITIFDTDNQDLSMIFKIFKPKFIIHLATRYIKFETEKDLHDMYESNVIFPEKLIHLAIENNVKGFINTGSFFEYDCNKLPVSETNRTHPINYYAKTKLIFEKKLLSLSNKINIQTFRIFTPYGEKDNDKLIPMLIKNSIDNKVSNLSDGRQKIDLIYAQDIVGAYLKGLKEMITTSKQASYEIYNLGSGKSLSIREIVNHLERIIGKEIKVNWGEKSNFDFPIVYADISKIERKLSWSPVFTIDQGLTATINYYLKKNNS